MDAGKPVKNAVSSSEYEVAARFDCLRDLCVSADDKKELGKYSTEESELHARGNPTQLHISSQLCAQLSPWSSQGASKPMVLKGVTFSPLGGSRTSLELFFLRKVEEVSVWAEEQRTLP